MSMFSKIKDKLFDKEKEKTPSQADISHAAPLARPDQLKFVVIGAGAAGITAAKRLRVMEADADITVISTDKYVHSRCMLHKYLGHERDVEGINFIPHDFFQVNNIRWVEGETITRVDPEEKMVHMTCGAYMPYDKLLIATGAYYFVPPIDNFREAKNVFGFRDFSDAKALDEAAEGKKNIFIVGSGLVGLDAASALCERGFNVSVAEMAERIMPLQTDDYAAGVYQQAFEKAGTTFYLGVGVSSSKVDANGNINTIILSDGREIPTDVVMVAAGVRPQIDFLKDSGIKVERGVTVDDYLQTSIPDIYAAGDVTGLSGVWPDAMEQGTTAAMNMCGSEAEYEKPYPFKNTSNFFGITMLSVGKLDVTEGCEVVTEMNRGTYKKAVIKDNKIQGILIQGDISNTGIYLYLIRKQIPIDTANHGVFDLSFADFYGIDEKTGAYQYAM